MLACSLAIGTRCMLMPPEEFGLALSKVNTSKPILLKMRQLSPSSVLAKTPRPVAGPAEVAAVTLLLCTMSSLCFQSFQSHLWCIAPAVIPWEVRSGLAAAQTSRPLLQQGQAANCLVIDIASCWARMGFSTGAQLQHSASN